MKLKDVLLGKPIEPVDCGNCPVNIQCAGRLGGTGWTYNCCHATSVDTGTALLIIDCQRHDFEQNEAARACTRCSLCSGEIVRTLEPAYGEELYFLPTVHAKFPIAKRVDMMKRAAALIQRETP